MKFKIFAGLGGGFGGATERGIFEFKNEEEANDYAYQQACEEYESMEGLHGLRSYNEIMEEDGLGEEEAELAYNEEREEWLDWRVEEVKEK